MVAVSGGRKICQPAGDQGAAVETVCGPRGIWRRRDLRTRGHDGAPTQVVLPYFRARKVAVMTLRSEADLQALKTQASRP